MSEELEQPEVEIDNDFDSDSEVEDNEDVEDIDDSEEQEAEDPEEPEIDLDDVEYEGKQYKLPRELKDALLRQADYTRKTQEVADQRRAVEAQRAQAQEAINLVSNYQKEYSELIGIDSQLQKFNELDWNAIISENPQDAMRLQARFNELRQQREVAVNNIQQVQQQVQQQREQEQQRFIAESVTTLQRDIPNWNNDLYSSVLSASQKNYGFSADEVNNVIDARYIKVLHDAMQWRQSQEKLKKQASKRPDPTPTKVTKSAKPVPKGLSDDLSDEEWMRRRNAELYKRRKNNF